MNLDDQLAELWAAGASFTDMGLKLGESRNVIAGRIDRARRAGDPRFRPRKSKPRELPPKQQRRVVKPIDEIVGNSRPLPRAAEPSGPRLLVDLAVGRCKFPVSDPPPGRSVEMLFCAEPVVQPGANYCSRHTEIAVRVIPSASRDSRGSRACFLALARDPRPRGETTLARSPRQRFEKCFSG